MQRKGILQSQGQFGTILRKQHTHTQCHTGWHCLEDGLVGQIVIIIIVEVTNLTRRLKGIIQK